MERSAEFWRGADWQWVHGATRAHIAEELAAAEAREAFPIPDTLPKVPEAREAGEPKGVAAWLTDNHVRTKDGKLCCVEVRRPDTHGGMACTWKMKDFDIQAEMDGSEVGEEIVLRYVELTDAEFTALGEFDGW